MENLDDYNNNNLFEKETTSINLLCDVQKKQRNVEFQKSQRLKILKQKRNFSFNTNEDSIYFLKNENMSSENFLDEYANFLQNRNNFSLNKILPFLKKLQIKTSEKQFPLKKFLDDDNIMIKMLIQLLMTDELPLIQYYTCWILANLLSSEENIPFDQIIYENGGLDNLLSLIRKIQNNDSDLYLQIIWVLGNFFASDNLPLSEINSKFYPLCQFILKNLNKYNEEMSVWSIANILKGNSPLKEIEFNDILSILVTILFQNQNDSVSLDIYSVISKYINEYKSTLEFLMKYEGNKFFCFLIEKLKNPTLDKKQIKIKCFICEILEAFSAKFHAYWTEDRILNVIFSYIDEKSVSLITQKCFWIIINLLNSSFFIDVFIKNQKYIKKIMSFVAHESEFSYLALRVFTVISRKGSYFHIEILATFGLIELFTLVIKDMKETKLLKLALEGLYNIFALEKEQDEFYQNKNFFLKFESLNGENILLDLQHHENMDVYNLVFLIFDEFFENVQN